VSGAARRTQADRRNETIGRLVDATIESILEVGYHRTSLGEVCTRSGVSRGGLFRHFDSRLDLVVAAAQEVATRHLATFDALRDAGATLDPEELLRFARGETREESNAVWFELLVAARTDPELRSQLRPVAVNLYDAIEERAVAASAFADVSEDLVRMVATSVIHMFDGEAIIRHTYPRPELEETRLRAVTKLVEVLRSR
jgi:AcrR family transcriptional regulator